MFDSPFRTTIELTLDDRVLRFDSEADFAFALEGRTDVCGEDCAALMAMSDAALEAEITRLEEDERFLRRHFEDALESPERLDERLAQIEPQRWRPEHRWNDLLCAVGLVAPSLYAIKRRTVMAYLDYLKARTDVAIAVMKHRDQRKHMSDTHQATAPLNHSSVAGGDTVDVRLPRGEATLVLDTDSKSAIIRFSRHRHRLMRTRPVGRVHEDSIELIDDAGKRWCVAPGVSCVGRDAGCEIALRAVLKDISRAHAIMNLDESGRVWITDTSSRGTFVVSKSDGVTEE